MKDKVHVHVHNSPIKILDFNETFSCTHTHTNIHRIHTKVLLGLASWIEQYVSKLVGLKKNIFEFRNQITDKMQNITQ